MALLLKKKTKCCPLVVLRPGRAFETSVKVPAPICEDPQLLDRLKSLLEKEKLDWLDDHNLGNSWERPIGEPTAQFNLHYMQNGKTVHNIVVDVNTNSNGDKDMFDLFASAGSSQLTFIALKEKLEQANVHQNTSDPLCATVLMWKEEDGVSVTPTMLVVCSTTHLSLIPNGINNLGIFFHRKRLTPKLGISAPKDLKPIGLMQINPDQAHHPKCGHLRDVLFYSHVMGQFKRKRKCVPWVFGFTLWPGKTLKQCMQMDQWMDFSLTVPVLGGTVCGRKRSYFRTGWPAEQVLLIVLQSDMVVQNMYCPPKAAQEDRFSTLTSACFGYIPHDPPTMDSLYANFTNGVMLKRQHESDEEDDQQATPPKKRESDSPSYSPIDPARPTNWAQIPNSSSEDDVNLFSLIVPPRPSASTSTSRSKTTKVLARLRERRKRQVEAKMQELLQVSSDDE